MAATTTFDRVYIWERPVRLYHWVTVLSVSTLIATGLVIGSPPAFLTAGDASAGRWFGTVRFLHFASGYVFLFAFVVRLYWMFMGNRYARWSNFLPVTPTLLKRQARQVWQVITTDLLELRVHPAEVRGHNALAAWTYTLVFLATAFQIVTGFGLYAPMSESWFPQLFAWVVPLMGGDGNVRLWHHLAAWFFIVFALVHVYLSVFHDAVEGEGEISSMIGGVKFYPRSGRGER